MTPQRRAPACFRPRARTGCTRGQLSNVTFAGTRNWKLRLYGWGRDFSGLVPPTYAVNTNFSSDPAAMAPGTEPTAERVIGPAGSGVAKSNCGRSVDLRDHGHRVAMRAKNRTGAIRQQLDFGCIVSHGPMARRRSAGPFALPDICEVFVHQRYISRGSHRTSAGKAISKASAATSITRNQATPRNTSCSVTLVPSEALMT
jgi:hypothetical protein